jgi:hypothetical protein
MHPGRRRSPRRIAGICVSTGALAAVVVAVGLPGRHAGPQDASADPVALAFHWFAGPPGALLHVRSLLTEGTGSAPASVQETWQVIGDGDHWRVASTQDGVKAEAGPDGIFDPARNTIYLNVAPGARQRAGARLAMARKIESMRTAGVSASAIATVRRDERRILRGQFSERSEASTAQPAGDPLVAQVRSILENGGASSQGREPHAGVDAYAIRLDPDAGQPARAPAGSSQNVRWTLWLAQSDGHPLELRVDGGPGTPPVETTVWTTYELSSDSAADHVSLQAAHPDARVVRDADALAAANARLFPAG